MTDVKPKIIFDPAGDEAYSFSNEHVEPLSVESLERMADEIAATLKGREPLKLAKPMRIVPPPEMKFAQLLEWHRTKMHEVCGIPVMHGASVDWEEIAKRSARALVEQSKKTIEMRAARVFNESADYSTAAMKARQDFRRRTHTRQDDDMIAGLAYACQMISDCARTASKTGAFKSDKIDLGDGIYVVRPPKPPVNKEAFFDHVKRFARENRIARNEMRVYPVIKQDVMAKTTSEHNLCQAIERTQLPHATTIHERIMPYRVKE